MMDREEARQLLVQQLAAYRSRSYHELVERIHRTECLQVQGPSGTEYQIEVQFMWDADEQGDIRISAAIDDGSLTGAFRPVCEDFIVAPDGRFVGEE